MKETNIKLGKLIAKQITNFVKEQINKIDKQKEKEKQRDYFERKEENDKYFFS